MINLLEEEEEDDEGEDEEEKSAENWSIASNLEIVFTIFGKKKKEDI